MVKIIAEYCGNEVAIKVKALHSKKVQELEVQYDELKKEQR